MPSVLPIMAVGEQVAVEPVHPEDIPPEGAAPVAVTSTTTTVAKDVIQLATGLWM